MKTLVTDLRTILDMETRDLWMNYIMAFDMVWAINQKDEPTQRDRYERHAYTEIGRRSLDLFFARIEEEVW